MRFELMLKRVHKEVEALHPKSEQEKREYFEKAWEKRLKRGYAMPIIYYPSGRG